MAKKKSVILYEREFQIVKRGLDEQQVRELVDELAAKVTEAEENAEKASYPKSLDRLGEQTVLEAEKLAKELEEEATQIRAQAQAEAVHMIAEAQSNAQEQAESIARVAKIAAAEAQRVLQDARGKGALIEAEGRRQAQRLLEFTKRRIGSQIRRDVKGASERLVQYMDDIMKEVQALGVNLDNWEEPSPEASSSLLEPAEVQVQSYSPGAEQASAAVEREAADTTLHEGALQVVIQAPVYPAGLGEVYERLVRCREITLRDTRKADDGSYILNLSVGYPTPLVDILEHLENVADVSVAPPAVDGGAGDGSGDTENIEGQHSASEMQILIKLKEQRSG